MDVLKNHLIKVLFFFFLMSNIFLFADSSNSSLIFTKPIQYYIGKPIPSNFQLLKLISLTTGKDNQAKDNNLLYQTYVSKGTVDNKKINELMKKHYAHLVINTVLIEHIEQGKLYLPADIKLDKKTILEIKQGYTSFMNMINKYYLNENYYVYSKEANDSPTFSDFVPVYSKAVRTAVEIESIEQVIFDNMNELLTNIDDREFVQHAIRNILNGVELIKVKMPYNNLPDNLLKVLFDVNEKYIAMNAKNKKLGKTLTDNNREELTD